MFERLGIVPERLASGSLEGHAKVVGEDDGLVFVRRATEFLFVGEVAAYEFADFVDDVFCTAAVRDAGL